MLDIQKVAYPEGWKTEYDACKEWVSDHYDSITYDLLVDPEHGKFLTCKDLPQPGSSISLYGEFGDEDRFSYIVESVDLDEEIVTAVSEEDGESIDVLFKDLCCLDNSPMWLTLWALYHSPTYSEIEMFNECGISVYKSAAGDFYLGIDGCGYDFIEAHWIPLYRKMGICWHSTEGRWLGELKARMKTLIEASTDLPKELTWSQRRDLLDQVSGDLIRTNKIARKVKLACWRYRFTALLEKIRSVPPLILRMYRMKRKGIA